MLEDDDYDCGSDSSLTSARQRQQTRSFGLVQWLSPRYKDKIITSFEDKWIEVQTHWLDMEGICNEVEGTQICALLDRFNNCLEDVYDNGGLV